MKVVASMPWHPSNEESMLRWSVLLECGHGLETWRKKGSGYPRKLSCPKCGDELVTVLPAEEPVIQDSMLVEENQSTLPGVDPVQLVESAPIEEPLPTSRAPARFTL